ncbi:MAG TPA: hypothetical protein VE057_01860 [Archangium sp.]|nr:hypothetical protein [Archangium sp.]
MTDVLHLDRDEWVDGWYTYYGWDFLPRVVSSGIIANARLVHGEQYYGGPLRGHPRIGFRCSRWLLPTAAGAGPTRRLAGLFHGSSDVTSQ